MCARSFIFRPDNAEDCNVNDKIRKKMSGITMGIQALGFFIIESINLFEVFL